MENKNVKKTVNTGASKLLVVVGVLASVDSLARGLLVDLAPITDECYRFM